MFHEKHQNFGIYTFDDCSLGQKHISFVYLIYMNINSFLQNFNKSIDIEGRIYLSRPKKYMQKSKIQIKIGQISAKKPRFIQETQHKVNLQVLSAKVDLQQKMIVKRKSLILLLLFAMSVAHGFLATSEVSVNYVSTSLNAYVSAQGSKAGGTTLYISGVNFSPVAAEIQIFFGIFPCNLIAEGSTVSFISCITTPMYDRNQPSTLPITIYTANLLPVTCSSSTCKFTYSDSYTPFINEIYPRTAIGNQQIFTDGIHRITNLGDGRSTSGTQLKYILINGAVCSTLDIVQLPISSNTADQIYCNTFLNQQAGEYIKFQESTIYGDASFSIANRLTNIFSGNNYTFRVAPWLDNTTMIQTGGTYGHILTLPGSGFSNNPANLSSFTCTIGSIACTVISTQTSSIQIKIPPYQAGYETTGKLLKQAADSSPQQSAYLGSYGFRKTRYNRTNSKDLGALVYDFRAGNTTQPIIYDGYTTQLSSTFNGISNYDDYLRGYFYAPVDGSYLFQATADDTIIVYMSKYQNNSNPLNMQVILRADGYTSSKYDPYNNPNYITSVTIPLKRGYYYMEIISRDFGYYNFYYVSVSIPSTSIGTKIVNPTWQVDNIVIKPTTILPEVITITVDSTKFAPKATFTLFYYYANNAGGYTKVSSAAILPGVNITTFQSAISKLVHFTDSNYAPSFRIAYLDANGAVVANPANAKQYAYSISYQIIRPSTYTSLPSCSVTSGVKVVKTQDHSPGLGGSYLFNINGMPLSVYDTSTKKNSLQILTSNSLYNLQAALQSFYGASQIIVAQRASTPQYPNQLDFNIIYLGVAAAPFPITIDVTALTGGNDNKFTVTITTRRIYAANKPYYTAIPYQFLRMGVNNPTLVIQYNNVPAICYNCFYTYQTTQPISLAAAKFKTSNLGLDLTLTSTIASAFTTFQLSDVTVTLYGQPCVIDSTSTTSRIYCTFNTITTSSNINVPQIPAGNDTPLIHIRQFGFVKASSTLKLKNDITISSITPSTMGANGEVVVTITGRGFPLVNSGSPKLKISAAGGNPAPVVKYLSISNLVVTFIFPPLVGLTKKSTTLVIQLNYTSYIYSYSDSKVINFDSSLDPSVTALSLQSASPILKQNILVTGTNFDLNKNNMKAYLYYAANLTVKYELAILSVNSSTTLVCVLGGGRTEDYYLRVLVVGKGMSAVSNANKFSYEIIVNSVSPPSGSVGGGYILTVNGANFAPAKGSTQVFIGNAINSICTIISINSTTIQCKVPAMSLDYKVGDSQNVLVTGRLIENSRCKGVCSFKYTDTDAIYLNNLNATNYTAGSIVTITSTTGDISTATVSVGSQAVSLLSAAQKTITFAYPVLTGGSYTITVSINGVNAYPPLQTTTPLVIGAISSTSGSNKGQIVSVVGNGFTGINNPSNIIYYICSGVSIILPIITIVPNNVTFQIPSNPVSACQVNVTMSQTFSLFNYAQSNAKTPSIVVTDLGSLVYQIVVSNTNNKVIKFIIARYLSSNNVITSTSYAMSWKSNGTNQYIVTPTDGYLPCGTFRIDVQLDTIGFADSSTNVFNKYDCTAMSQLAPTPISVSFGGFGNYYLGAAGFITNNIQNNEIRVCGMRASIVSANKTGLVFNIPPFVNAMTRNMYGLGAQQILTDSANIISDTSMKLNYAFDNNTKTSYFSNSSVCFIGLDLGLNSQALLTKIRYMPNAAWITLGNYFDGAVFEGSNDQLGWTLIYAINSQQIHTGWNVWLDSTGSNIYRYVRFRQTNGLSNCQLAEIQFTGIVYSTVTYASTLPCQISVVFNNPAKKISLPGAITYLATKTSVITSISPAFGPSTGGTTLTITGTNFDSNPLLISVVIDGVPCVVSSVTSTKIQCVTGQRSTPPTNGNSFIVISASNVVILSCPPYLYMDRWSSDATWGGEAQPRDGDTVYVPPGMTLLVDKSTPYLNSIIVEGGKIIFSDQIDMTVDANYFIMIGGQFRAGLPSSPYKSKLTITLYGGYYDKQLPYFGNKVLGCLNCVFNLHGTVRNPTWSELNVTVNPGDNKLTLIQSVDWQVGQMIAVAATGYNHFESEQKKIVQVSADGRTLSVDTPFVYRHFAGIERYGGKDFIMRAEVGLLTRNIVIQGDNMTNIYNHGSHLILMGSARSGLNAALSYTQVRNCGQPKIIARYCTHFHMAGEVPNSFVRGISVHHSLARVLTIHGTHYLLVEKNVGYLVQGHNIFIEDGIETYNIIQDNLMISSIASQTLLQSDTSVASYWITNPSNTVIRNHAAGGDFYGFWYEIKPNPDGPSATPNICPTGMSLGLSSNNFAHSNKRFGLRIFNYAARKYPCLPIEDQSLVNPYDFNPVYESVFSNYTLWKNQENGLLGEVLGYTTFDNFLIIDSVNSGMQFYVTNVSLQNVTARNSVIVGFSLNNTLVNVSSIKNARGLTTPRSDGFKAENIVFANFGPNMTPLQSCSKCQNLLFWVTGGKTSFFRNITYSNIMGNYIYWNGWRRQIFVDEDGTLTAPIAKSLGLTGINKASITPYFPHLNIPNRCYNVIPLWHNSSYCDNTITIRSVLYTNADPTADFYFQNIKTFRLNTLSDPDNSSTSLSISTQPMIKIESHDIMGSWAFPYAVGYSYHTHFNYGIDFLHLSLAPSQYWQSNQAIVLKFNYSDNRQFYNIGHYYSKKLQYPLITNSSTLIDPSTCSNGDYFHNNITRHLYVCIGGKNKKLREWIDVTGVRCKNYCPKSDPTSTRETFTRLWSNATQWPNKVLPKAGDNATIPYEWNIVLDISPPALNFILINGLMYFDQKDLTLQANTIWIQQGGLYIGSQSQPFTNQATIILNGGINDAYTVIDPYASGNKMLAVTGALEMYGTPPTITWTRLTAIAPAKANTITVENATGWKVGNEIVIAPTYAGQKEDQVFKIVAISGQTITLNASLAYQHYGDLNIVTNSKGGQMDVRGAVGLLTRNIKITKGYDVNNWGCRVLVYSYLVTFTNNLPPQPVNGYAILDGVELDGCGQYGSSNAGLRIQKLGTLLSTTYKTSVTRSTIRNCNGYCAYIDTSKNVTFDNNVFHNAQRYTVWVGKVNNYLFTNNLLIGLRKVTVDDKTGIFPDNAAYQQYTGIKYGTDIVLVTNNLVQGSEGEGFVFPFTMCNQIGLYPFARNTAGSCLVAFALNGIGGSLCLAASGFNGYASQIGFMANPPGLFTQIQYQNMFFIDNQRGFTMRYAHEYNDNTMLLSDSYFMGYSRPNCPSCYSPSTISYCNNGYAIRMFVATLSGETFPNRKDITNFDIVCTQQAFDAKAFLTNVTFENYQYYNEDLPYCSSMSVFRKHDQASDAVAAHHLYQSNCINCDLSALVYFAPSNPAWAGWSGGCGQMQCTGAINYFIHDHDGYFTKLGTNVLQPTQLLANNQPIGQNQAACIPMQQWNGYWCKFQELAILQYQSIAADFNKRMVWPLYLKYDGGSWTSVTNAWKEWVWVAPGVPAELRLARFWSVIKLRQNYNMTYSSQPPSDSVYQIQKRQLPYGNPNDWAVIRIYFPIPNAIIVRVTNTSATNVIVPSYQQTNGAYPDLTKSAAICGANNYRFETNVIQFVVNGKNNCQVRLTVSSYVQLTVNFQIDINSFYTNKGQTTILTNIMALLRLDFSQIKILSVNSGQLSAASKNSDAKVLAGTAVTTVKISLVPKDILSSVPTVNANASDPNSEQNVSKPLDVGKSYNELQSYANSLNSSTKFGLPVISVSSIVYILDTGGFLVTVCPKTFLYNTTSQICYCSAGSADISGACVPCSSVGNSTGVNNPNNTRRCTCKPSFIWSVALGSCQCAEHSIIANGSCFSCVGLNNSAQIANLTSSTCVCKPTFIFNTKKNVCQCPDTQSYINSTGFCVGCTGFPNGTGKVVTVNNSKQCQCRSTYSYSVSGCSCASGSYLSGTTCVKCSSSSCVCPSNMIFKPAKKACGCFDDNSAIINNTCYSCSNANSTGVATNGSSCKCLLTFVFINFVCQCPTSNHIILNGACVSCLTTNNNYSGQGVAPNNSSQCLCKDQYTWANGICICGSNSMLVNGTKCYLCSNIPNTLVLAGKSLAACSCLNNLQFDPIKLICYCLDSNSIIRNKVCVSCTSSLINGVAKASSISCTCSSASNLVWDPNTQSCLCASGYFSVGTQCKSCALAGNSTNVAYQGVSCICNPTFIWNPNTLSCVCGSNSILATSTKCLSCDQFIGSIGRNLADNTRCNCTGNMMWDSLKKICVCANNSIILYNGLCYACSSASDANIINPPLDNYNCRCGGQYIWDNIQLKCVLCSNSTIPYATQKTQGYELTCDCLTGYYFDIYTNLCLKVPNPDCNDGNISNCISCKSIPQADIITGPISLTLGTYLNARDVSIIALQYFKLNSTISKYKSYQCYCNGGYFWEPNRKRCEVVFI